MNTLFKIALFILFSSSFGFATADGPDNFDIQGVALNDVLWIHPTPNYKSTKIGQIPYDAKCIKNLGCKGQWCKVNYRGTVGWVNGMFLIEGSNCPQVSYSKYSQKKLKNSQQKFTRQMLEGKILQTREYNSDLTVKFLPPRFKSCDGDMIFHFSSNADDDNEILCYRLIDGKIVYYGNDGSKYRLTLVSADHQKWIMLEEEDIDGDDKQFDFTRAVKKEFMVKKSKVVQKNDKLILATQSDEMIDQLMMQIYGRMDTRIASRRDHIKNINNFLHKASLLLIKKHKLNLKMQEHRRNQMAAVAPPPEVVGLMTALASIEKLDGKTIVDHNENKLITITELKNAYYTAATESMQMQRDNYASEHTRESDFTKLEKQLVKSGSSEQKQEIKNLEIMRLKGEYKYYKQLLDNSSIWCLADRNVSQKKPLFYPKTFVIELLYSKYQEELFRSQKPYDINELLERAKEIEKKSKIRKNQFNNDYLYDIRKKPDRLKNKF